MRCVFTNRCTSQRITGAQSSRLFHFSILEGKFHVWNIDKKLKDMIHYCFSPTNLLSCVRPTDNTIGSKRILQMRANLNRIFAGKKLKAFVDALLEVRLCRRGDPKEIRYAISIDLLWRRR